MGASATALEYVKEKELRYRYETSGQWYKGSIHLHTVGSDGHLTLGALARKYADENYDFISVTDHWSLPALNGNRKKLPLLVIDGMELDGHDNQGTYYHVLAIGSSMKPPLFTRNFTRTLKSAYDHGAILISAHPYWTGNTVPEGLRHKFHGLEIYNHSSHCENGSGYALSYWDGMLKQKCDFLGFATDDSHFTPGQPYWNGGWIMVNAKDCTRGEILSSIRNGDFYASQGPDFKSFAYEENRILVETSPVMYARLIGPRRQGEWVHALDRTPICRAEFEIPSDWPYARLEIEDAAGKRAWTNPLWTLGQKR